MKLKVETLCENEVEFTVHIEFQELNYLGEVYLAQVTLFAKNMELISELPYQMEIPGATHYPDPGRSYLRRQNLR